MVRRAERDVLDLVIVGAGIAGGALATVMARRGARVLVLERQRAYRDHVRGEILWQWGVAEARRIGVEDTLLESGALVVPRAVLLDEAADPITDDLATYVPEIPGSLNLAHPIACAALADAARAAGADVRLGVENVRITPGRNPAVRWSTGERAEEARCRLIVGADGRRSTVRDQAGLRLEVDPPGNCIAGLLVDRLERVDAQTNVLAREADLLFYAFPQRDGRARLYLTFPAEQRQRLAGRDSAARFMATASLACVPDRNRWTAGRPAGPCATFLCAQSRVDPPGAPGVVLVGDAGGYQNPLQGQGLSFAIRDARDLSELLVGSPRWDEEMIGEYGAARAPLRRLAGLAIDLDLWINEGYRVQDPEMRASRFERAIRDEVLATLVDSAYVGFDSLQGLTAEVMWARLDAG